MSSETLVAERHRVFRPGDVCPPVTFTDGERSGYVMHDGDCPYSDSDVIDLCYDDGLPDSSSVCGFGDGDRMCCAPGVYTGWFGGMCPIDDHLADTGNPAALCPGHAEVVRGWPELIRMHQVRPAGTAAEWAS